MINLFNRNVWLYQKGLDFRKQMNGLIEVVASQMEMKPIDGSLYVFRNKKKDKLKLLIWERNGFFLGYKRIEKGRFDFPESEDGNIKISWEQMYLLISGLPMTKLELIDQKKITHFF